MNRYTPDRKSFEQFLAAASLLQQVKKQAVFKSPTADRSQPLVSLLQLQRGINSGALDLESAMSEVVELVVSVTGADSAGVWLFRGSNEFSCCARTGPIYDPERLGTDILARLATTNQPASDSLPDSTNLRRASHYPGYPNSVAIAALRIGGKILGAVAGLSTVFDAFSRRDLDNLDFLAGLLAGALQTAMRSGCHQAIALEHSALLQVLESRPLLDLESRPHLNKVARPVPEQPSQRPAIAHAQENTHPAIELVQPSPSPPRLGEFDLAKSANAPLHSGADGAVENVSLPGVGVRAALGDVREYTGVSEPSFLRSAIGRVRVRAREFAVGCGSGIRRAAHAALMRAHLLTSQATTVPTRLVRNGLALSSAQIRLCFTRVHDSLFATSRRTVRVRVSWPRLSRPGLPHMDFSRIKDASVHLLSWPRSALPTCRNILHRMEARLGVGRVQARALGRGQPPADADSFAMLAEQRIGMRSTSLHRKSTPVGELARNVLHRTGKTLAEVATYAGRSTETVLRTIRAKSSAISFNKRAVRKSAGAMVVLAAMTTFLTLQANLHNSFRSEPVRAATASTTHQLSDHRQPGLATAARGKPAATSHLEITDSSVKDALHELTKYEIATLERVGYYGDDEAAFQLGMAYETGYYVRQDCSQAAHWVKLAAEAGNPAAAYNLALRYKDGDGVLADHSAAEHWLQVASKLKYSPSGSHGQSEGYSNISRD